MSRAKILQKIESARAIVDDGKGEVALPLLLEIENQIVDSKFYPALDFILPLIINILEKEKDYPRLCMYYMLRNSPYLQLTDYRIRFSELSDFLNRVPDFIKITIPPMYSNILPLSASFRFLPEQIFIGDKIHLICDFVSSFSQVIHVTDISIELLNSDSSIQNISLGEQNLIPHKFLSRPLDFDLVKSQSVITNCIIISLTYVIGNVQFRIKNDFNATVYLMPRITSDENSLNGKSNKSPFSFETKFFDHNYQPLAAPIVEIGEIVTVEITLTNIIDYTFTIKNIISNIETKCYDLPVELFPGEQYNFLAIIDKECVPKFTVNYLTELSPDDNDDNTLNYTFVIDEFPQFNRNLTMNLEYPSIVAKGQPFEAVLTLEIVDNSPYVQVFIEIVPSQQFFIDGPARKSIFLFAGQRKEVKIGFVPLTAGPTILPAIYVNNIGIRETRPRLFLKPIIVTF